MKKGNLSNYFKLATVLLIDAIPVWFVISLTIHGSDTDFIGFGLIIMLLFFFVFNIWAFVLYRLTKLIKRLWLRDTLFYLLLFLFLFSPLLIPGLFIGAGHFPY